MTPPGKRKSDVVDLTGGDADVHHPKVGRIASSKASNGQRFGQDTEFIPFSELYQPALTDEDDTQAADLIQGSQDFDDTSLNDYTLYGIFIFIRYLSLNVFGGLTIGRQGTHQDRGCPLLYGTCNAGRARYPKTRT